MMLDNHKDCCDVFMALQKKCFESETEDMLLREMLHCKRNMVDDMRQHLLEAIIDCRFKNEGGSSYEMEHFLQKCKKSVRLYKSMHSNSNGPIECHVKNVLK